MSNHWLHQVHLFSCCSYCLQGLKPGKQLFGAFGFGDFGSVVLSAINCPDNVPPLLHYGGDQWDPLFPRVPREG